MCQSIVVRSNYTYVKKFTELFLKMDSCAFVFYDFHDKDGISYFEVLNIIIAVPKLENWIHELKLLDK